MKYIYYKRVKRDCYKYCYWKENQKKNKTKGGSIKKQTSKRIKHTIGSGI